jgi:hypothetical protein
MVRGEATTGLSRIAWSALVLQLLLTTVAFGQNVPVDPRDDTQQFSGCMFSGAGLDYCAALYCAGPESEPILHVSTSFYPGATQVPLAEVADEDTPFGDCHVTDSIASDGVYVQFTCWRCDSTVAVELDPLGDDVPAKDQPPPAPPLEPIPPTWQPSSQPLAAALPAAAATPNPSSVVLASPGS